ncbi:hypothetical protein K1J48_07880, partial [Enterobacter hormaechei]|nr:hypothetical protein [Enterobacter hormaechei]
DRNRSHWSTSKTPSYTKSVSWQHHPVFPLVTSLAIQGTDTLAITDDTSLDGQATITLKYL